MNMKKKKKKKRKEKKKEKERQGVKERKADSGRKKNTISQIKSHTQIERKIKQNNQCTRKRQKEVDEGDRKTEYTESGIRRKRQRRKQSESEKQT